MRKGVCVLSLAFAFIFAFAFSALADSTNAQPVEIVPLATAVSFSTVTLGTSWVTAPTIEMRGRKEINILNTSETANVLMRSVSSNTVTTITRRIPPLGSVTLKASSDLHIYLSSNTIGTIAEIIEIK